MPPTTRYRSRRDSIRERTRELLRQEATKDGEPNRAAVRELVEWYEVLLRDEVLTEEPFRAPDADTSTTGEQAGQQDENGDVAAHNELEGTAGAAQGIIRRPAVSRSPLSLGRVRFRP